MRHAGKIGLLLVGTFAAAAFAAVAQQAGPLEEPLLVNYGKFASGKSGDNDHRQAIYLSVPATTTDKIYVRIFDGDTNNSTSFFDKMDRPATTRVSAGVAGSREARPGPRRRPWPARPSSRAWPRSVSFNLGGIRPRPGSSWR